MKRRSFMLLFVALFLVACSKATPTATDVPTATLPPPTAALPSPTPAPKRVVICSLEPDFASPLVSTQTGDDIVALFYEPPLEQVAYEWVPRLVERVPSLENGDVISRTVPVLPGERYVDASGVVQVNNSDATLELSQLVVDFRLKPSLSWSDGVPLTTDDFIFAYHLAQETGVSGYWRDLVERTARFRAINKQTLRWEGLPGYLSADFGGLIFPPQPEHRWKGLALSDILQDLTPPGTGAFDIVAWERGREIRLQLNPYYVGDPPALEEIVVRFPSVDINQWPGLLASGECDIILPNPAISIDWAIWASMMNLGQAEVWADAGPSPSFLRIDFNLSAVEANPVSDLRVRQALGHCIDRIGLATALPAEALMPAVSFLPPAHPAFAGDELESLTYDPEQGAALLDEAGWRDEDGDGFREAYAVPGFEDGTPLSLTLYLTPQYIFPAAHLSADLELCGVQLTPKPVDTATFYTPAAASPLFGRSFDLALFGWQATAPHVCGAWLAERVPSAETDWMGENFSGYRSEIYNRACARALLAVDQESQWDALRETQVLLSQDLPTLFIAWRPYWLVSRPGIVGIQVDAATSTALWNIEAIDVDN
ncbi:MAG: hypothetical protein JW981_01645 [Anaerolineae bacterium]|nr:hypothetical protein [Anaerolineae bacterium]